MKQAAESAGQVVGGLAGATHGPAGAVGGAFALGKVAKMAQTVFASARWKLASAQAKDRLAEALVGGKTGEIMTLLSRITAVEGAKAGQ